MAAVGEDDTAADEDDEDDEEEEEDNVTVTEPSDLSSCATIAVKVNNNITNLKFQY